MDANSNHKFKIEFEDFNQALPMSADGSSFGALAGVTAIATVGGYRNQSTARNAFRIFPNSGGTLSGIIRVEGIRV